MDIIQSLPACEANIEVVNPRIVEIREDFRPRENNLSRVDHLTLTSYEGNTCFAIPKLLLRCLKKLLNIFCFIEDNNNSSGLVNTITEPELKTELPCVGGCMFGLSNGLFP